MTTADKHRTAANEQTPMTDAEAFDQECCGEEYNPRYPKSVDGAYVYADFARQLERSLSTANARLERLRGLASELYAMVRGECPSLLNEDSGGNAELELALRAELGKE